MRKKNNLIFIIPVYNEEEVIEKVIENIFLNLKNFEFKILLINDGSKDKSLDKIKIIKEKFTEKVEYIDQENIGHGPTVIKGYKYAIDNDCEEAWLLDKDGYITEGSSSNAWIVKNKTIITRPVSNAILNGITRTSLIKSLMKVGYQFSERRFNLKDIKI